MESTNNNTTTAAAAAWSNRTGTTQPEDEEVKLSYQVLTSFLLGALILCAIFGNACVVAAVALERSLQNVASYLIGSLAVTDLMVSVLVLPMAALHQVLNRWTLGQVPCDIFISLDMLCCTSSILHLCAIALDRYWAITEPIEYMKKRTPRRAALLIGVTWLVGFSISVPPMLIMSSQPGGAAELNPTQCKIRQDPWYTIYSTFGAFYIPLILMLVLYGRIFKAARFRIRKTVRKTEKNKKVSDSCSALSPALFHKKSGADAQQHQQQQQSKSWKRSVEPRPRPLPSVNGAVRHAEDGESLEIIEVHGGSSNRGNLPLPNSTSTTTTGSSAPLFESRHEKATEAKRKIALARERKTVKTLGIIMGTFILCWLPFFIVALVMPFCPDSCYMPRWLGDVINWLGYSNSLLNPIIYAYFNKDFQSAFKKIIKCHFCRP
ncbi:5-hydroxytryptamine (serotonin) receptor 1A b isoform X3 [Scophthalmus maximus]|uniref:5-hydroxytryptamine (serotonin) receptor 1A b isoform X2 n=1 Tax=Scophthalmus maximus TaxID=52904 RepID=UPI001FA8905A|nr:5-hydroxytryptamine (serotonin) receptor 1A b isoform X2 [Scophthalmus maximus]XP_047185591.1 5-hydroxytryptamine (serotonin) receptor 1A b isoform X3 [Scophthalmus maximus]